MRREVSLWCLISFLRLVLLAGVVPRRMKRSHRLQITIVAGPWAHGQWSSGEGITALGDVEFFSRTEEYYRE